MVTPSQSLAGERTRIETMILPGWTSQLSEDSLNASKAEIGSLIRSIRTLADTRNLSGICDADLESAIADLVDARQMINDELACL